LISLAKTKPKDIGSSCSTLTFALHYRVQKAVLSLSFLNKVSPSTQIMTHTQISFPVDNSFQLLGRFNSACQHFSFLHESLAPQVEKLLRPFETDITID
jgi:hypothetical protein